MSDLKNELSKKSPYYISKHRFLELKHWCLQYDDWVKELMKLNVLPAASVIDISSTKSTESPTENYALRMTKLHQKIDLLNYCCDAADQTISTFIFLAVTQERSYNNLAMTHNLPCSRDHFYDAYRKFFYILSQKKG